MFFHRTQRVSVWMNTLFVSFLLAGFLCAIAGSVHADDVKPLLKQANNELRNAEKLMFSGKNDEAIDSVPRIRALIEQAKSADPENVSVKTAENKLLKLIKDLERRTGKDLGAGTLTARDASEKQALPPKPKVVPFEKTAA